MMKELEPLVEELVGVALRRPAGTYLRALEEQFGATDLSIACERLVSWIQSRYLGLDAGPLTWEPEYVWGKQLPTILRAFPELLRLFKLRESELDFNGCIPAEERQAVSAFVSDRYRPRIHRHQPPRRNW
jgi:hypothetical protein